MSLSVPKRIAFSGLLASPYFALAMSQGRWQPAAWGFGQFLFFLWTSRPMGGELGLYFDK